MNSFQFFAQIFTLSSSNDHQHHKCLECLSVEAKIEKVFRSFVNLGDLFILFFLKNWIENLFWDLTFQLQWLDVETHIVLKVIWLVLWTQANGETFSASSFTFFLYNMISVSLVLLFWNHLPFVVKNLRHLGFLLVFETHISNLNSPLIWFETYLPNDIPIKIRFLPLKNYED